jgi:uncharacterized protein (UPF0128 family)
LFLKNKWKGDEQNMNLEEMQQLELQNNKEHDKQLLIKRGENVLYAKLREKGKNAYGVMKIHDYVEMLKTEIQKESEQSTKQTKE